MSHSTDYHEHLIYSFSDFTFDSSTLVLSGRNGDIPLDSTLRGVLLLLLSVDGHVVTKDEFFDQVWQGRVVEESNLSVAISRLRKSLSPNGGALIQTVHKVGYKFQGAIEREIVKVPFAGLNFEVGAAVPGHDGWVFIRELGIGGFGEVWLAENVQSSVQQVFKFSVGAKGLRALKREAAVSSIIYSSGTHTAGFLPVLHTNFSDPPFSITMPEAGVNLPDWIDLQGGIEQLDLKSRLHLITSICGIVEHAHGLGIFHQDIKPSNVLVSGGKDSPTIHLVDFGSSAVLDEDRVLAYSSGALLFERTQSEPALTGKTIAYMAPEIAKGFAPTARSDVFSIGVLLYQLLCGDFSRLISPGWERDVEDHLLRDDIQNATQGNPELRIGNASELKERLSTLDLRKAAHLDELRQSARTTELEAQVAKANARRPWLIGAIGILIIGVFTSTGFFVQANSAKIQATKSLATLEAMNEFLSDDLVRTADPRFGGVIDIQLIDALRIAQTKIGDRFPTQAYIRGRLKSRLGDIYARLGFYEESVDLYQQAAIDFDDSTDTQAIELRLLADGKRSRSMFRMGKHGEAGALAEATHSSSAQHLGTEHPVTTLTGMFLARVPYESGLNVESLEAFIKLQPKIEGLPAEYAEYRISAELHIISILLNLQRMPEAGARLMPLLNELEQMHGSVHPDTLLARYYLGVHQHYSGDLEAAERTLVDAYDDMKAAIGASAWNTLDTLGELCQIYLDGGDFKRAAQSFGDLYRRRVELSGPENVTALMTQRNWAVALRKSGDVAGALRELRENTDKFNNLLGDKNPQTVIGGWETALTLIELGESEEARSIYEAISEKGEAMLANEPQWPPRKNYLLGRIWLAEGDRQRALPLLIAAKEEFVRLFGKSTEFITEMEIAIQSAQEGI